MENTNNTNILESILINVNGIKDILYHYYGEERVDIQLQNILTLIETYKPSLTSDEKIAKFICSNNEKIPILIHFPEVTITNEYNDSLLIKDLYVKFYIFLNGYLSLDNFYITRTTFTYAQFNSGYIHSHTPTFSPFPIFKTPCLGEGPIKNTIRNLQLEYDINLWNLFCIELDQYVKTESITGGPYIRITSLVNHSTPIKYTYDIKNNQYPELFSTFFNYFLQDVDLPIIWCNSYYSLGMSLSNFHILVSNHFIEWFNNIYLTNKSTWDFNKLLTKGYLVSGVYKNNTIHINCLHNQIHINNSKILTFKNKDIFIKIEADYNEKALYILNSSIITSFYKQFIYLINYTFNNNGNYIL